MGLPGFEPGSTGPKPIMITRLHHNPNKITINRAFINIVRSTPEQLHELKGFIQRVQSRVAGALDNLINIKKEKGKLKKCEIRQSYGIFKEVN